MRLVAALLLLWCGVALGLAQGLQVVDAFARRVDQRGITLVDWEGQIANPAIKLTVRLPKGMVLPADLHFSSTCPRIHFDRTTSEDRYGIGKRVRLTQPAETVDFLVSIFPDRDGKDEEHELMIQLFSPASKESARLLVPVRVIDQDKPQRKPSFQIHLDFSEDRTGFFRGERVRKVVRQAADDWAYFIEDPGFDIVKAGDEHLEIWNSDGFKTTRPLVNKASYTGYLMYMSGIHHEELRAGGAPSDKGKFQKVHGHEVPLRRSGTVQMEIKGNWNMLGWFMGMEDDDWWLSGSQRNEQQDLYSIALHEMGHALAFQSDYPRWGAAKNGDGLHIPALQAYTGMAPRIDPSDHLTEVTDPVSQYGAFGCEYLGRMKERRWLLTKTHLLCLQAVGYTLRDVSCFHTLDVPSSFDCGTFRAERPGSATIPASGGVPSYFFSLESGNWPAGLTLDSFTGTVSGRAIEPGVYEPIVKVQDNDPTTPARHVELRIVVTTE